jgi:hypothetical protein
VKQPDPTAYELVVVTLGDPEWDLSWIQRCERVLDCTHRLARDQICELV